MGFFPPRNPAYSASVPPKALEDTEVLLSSTKRECTCSHLTLTGRLLRELQAAMVAWGVFWLSQADLPDWPAGVGFLTALFTPARSSFSSFIPFLFLLGGFVSRKAVMLWLWRGEDFLKATVASSTRTITIAPVITQELLQKHVWLLLECSFTYPFSFRFESCTPEGKDKKME